MAYEFNVVLTKVENAGYNAEIVELNCVTSGKDVEEAVEMAKDAATGVVLVMEDEKIRIAPALTVGEIPLECGQLITRIKVDSGSARAYDEEIRERHNLICAMNTIVQSMKSEDAYSRWMRVAPGKADEDDLETIAADDDLFKDCVSMFNAITSSFYVRHGSFVGAKSY